MERIALSELKKWYTKSRRKPLVVWGARQVGKTYLVKNLFAEKEFSDYVYIDLKKDKDARDFFRTTSDAASYLQYIEARYGKKITPSVPLIFDESQQCSSVLTALKYFKQDFPELPVIATGSMVRLSLRHNEQKKEENDFLFPVGAIDSIHVYPLNFEEYLLNSNKILLERIKAAYYAGRPLEKYEHELALDAMYEYLSIGGMPEAAGIFLEEKSYVDAKAALKEIYDNYLSDMDSYNVSNETILKTRNVYKNIFAQLNKENKNFKVTQIEKGKSNRDYFNAYQWLELARIVYRSRRLEGKINLPFMENEEGTFRLYLSDAGMFSYQSDLPMSDFFVRDKRNTLSGIFYENYVATELTAKGIPLYYWTGGSSHEFEFIVQNNGLALPIDVKRGGGKLNSLSAFRTHNTRSTAIKISSNNYGYNAENDILTLPLYEVFLLADDLNSGKDIVKKQ